MLLFNESRAKVILVSEEYTRKETIDEPDEGEAPKVSLRARVIMTSFMVFVTLLLAELTLRLLWPEVKLRRRMSEAGLYVPFAPGGVGDHVAPEFRVRYTINKFGFRDQARLRERQPGRPRVLVLGDSFTVGWGVEQDQSYVSRLQAAWPEAELWNTARSGNNPLFYVFQSPYFRQRYQPDALLIQLFDNDVHEIDAFKRRFEFNEAGEVVGIRSRYRGKPSFSMGVKRVWNNLMLRAALKKLRRKLDGSDQLKHFLRPGVPAKFESVAGQRADMTKKLNGGDEAFETYFEWYHPERREAYKDKFALEAQCLKQIIEDCQKHKIAVAFLYIPHVLVWEPGPRFQKLRHENPHRAVIRELCKAHKVLFLDGLELLKAHPKPSSLYFGVDLHLNVDGHKVLAEQLQNSALKAFVESLKK